MNRNPAEDYPEDPDDDEESWPPSRNTFSRAVTRIRAGMNGTDPLYESFKVIQADMAADHRAKVARWEAQRPQREAAFRAMEAANARRRRALGLDDDVKIPIAASVRPLWAMHPNEWEHIY